MLASFVRYNPILSALETDILSALYSRAYALTKHLALACVGNSSRTAERLIQRACVNLKKNSLVKSRIVTMVHKGRANRAMCWSLTYHGLRKITTDARVLGMRVRKYREDAGIATLQHDLWTNQIEAEIRELESKDIGFKVDEMKPTLEAVTGYPVLGGWAEIRPDLFATTTYKGEAKHWFFETDCLNTGVGEIIKKCQRYVDYLAKTMEEYKGNVPTIVWVEVDNAHKDKTREERAKANFSKAIAEALPDYAPFFKVITASEVAQTVLGEANNG
jgi:hypothetical protein